MTCALQNGFSCTRIAVTTSSDLRKPAFPHRENMRAQATFP